MLSLRLKRSYEPLRLPTQAGVLSFPYARRSAASPPPELDLQHWATNLQKHADPATPGVDGATSVVPTPIQRPSPSVHRVGFSNSFTRLLMGSLALRPALLLCGNSRPRVAATPLPHATGAHGQLPGRDFNPLDLLLLLRTNRPRFSMGFLELAVPGNLGGHASLWNRNLKICSSHNTNPWPVPGFPPFRSDAWW